MDVSKVETDGIAVTDGVPQGSVSGPLYLRQTLTIKACVEELVNPEVNRVNILVLKRLYEDFMILELFTNIHSYPKGGMNRSFFCTFSKMKL